MNLTELKSKHRDVVIILTVSEIVEQGVKALAARHDQEGIAGEVAACALDIKATYDNNYNDFRNIIKRAL